MPETIARPTKEAVDAAFNAWQDADLTAFNARMADEAATRSDKAIRSRHPEGSDKRKASFKKAVAASQAYRDARHAARTAYAAFLDLEMAFKA